MRSSYISPTPSASSPPSRGACSWGLHHESLGRADLALPATQRGQAWLYRWKTIEALKGFVKEPKRFFVLFIEDMARAADAESVENFSKSRFHWAFGNFLQQIQPSRPRRGRGAPSTFFDDTYVTGEGVTGRGVVASCDVTLLQPGMQIQQGLNLWKEQYYLHPMAYVSSMAVAKSLRRQG